MWKVLYRKDLLFEVPAIFRQSDYEEVAALDMGTEQEVNLILGDIFYLMNRGREEYKDASIVDLDKLKIRSMSVGDIVITPSGLAFCCDNMGWKLIEWED